MADIVWASGPLIGGRDRFGFAGGTLTLVETFAPFSKADADAASREGAELPAETLALAEALSG